MPVSRDSSGTQSATLDTEHTLASPTAAGYYQPVVDLSAMLNGDVVKFRVKVPALNGGTERTVFCGIYSNAQGADNAMAISPLVPVVDASDFTLEQTDGTAGRDFPWSINLFTTLTAAQVNAEVVDVMRTDTLPDSYAADGAQPTIAQAILAINQFLTERSVSGTTVSMKKPDGSSVVMTFTLNSATTPTSITRAT